MTGRTETLMQYRVLVAPEALVSSATRPLSAK
jgi:hypothetical protein